MEMSNLNETDDERLLPAEVAHLQLVFGNAIQNLLALVPASLAFPV